MARANRHFIPGYVWHLTHRCHKREFLLKFSKDRDRWMELLVEAKQRYRLSILNFKATSNHAHLIMSDDSGSESIPRAMQFIAGRIGQEYNRRKNRQGAFWQDRYHTTAIELGDHLWLCLVYVDSNMVRADVVDHPSEWKWSGYHEIQKPTIRYRLIDHSKLLQLLNTDTHEALAGNHRRWVESQLKCGSERQEHFSRSIAVGSKLFIQKVRQALGTHGIGRRMAEAPAAGYQLKEAIEKYGSTAANPAESDYPKLPDTNTVPWKWEDSFPAACPSAEMDLEKPYQDLKEQAIEAFTLEYLNRLLGETGGNVSAAAQLRGMKRQSLQKIIRRYGIDVQLLRS